MEQYSKNAPESEEAVRKVNAAFEAKLNESTPMEADDLKRELKITDELLEARNKVLSLIPECPVHGFCLPHFKEWIESAKTHKSKLDESVNEVFVWLLGYNDFPQREDGQGAYYWRSELRKKLDEAGIKLDFPGK